MLRFIGKMLIAKREIDSNNKLNRFTEDLKKAKKDAQKNLGRVTIHPVNTAPKNEPTVDTDFIDESSEN